VAGAFLIGLVIGLGIYILIGALVLRAACWISNKCLPQPQPRYDDDDDYDDRDRDDDYDDRPVRRRRGRAPLTAIPEPNFGKACGIVAVNVLIQMAIGFVLGMMMGAGGLRGGGIGAAQVLNVVIGFFITAMLCTAMLPTTFGKACLVSLFNFLIWLLIGVIVVVALIATIGLNF
jgi:ABC-type antimicrobial peptide transport system permease subunit